MGNSRCAIGCLRLHLFTNKQQGQPEDSSEPLTPKCLDRVEIARVSWEP